MESGGRLVRKTDLLSTLIQINPNKFFKCDFSLPCRCIYFNVRRRNNSIFILADGSALNPNVVEGFRKGLSEIYFTVKWNGAEIVFEGSELCVMHSFCLIPRSFVQTQFSD